MTQICNGNNCQQYMQICVCEFISGKSCLSHWQSGRTCFYLFWNRYEHTHTPKLSKHASWSMRQLDSWSISTVRDQKVKNVFKCYQLTVPLQASTYLKCRTSKEHSSLSVYVSLSEIKPCNTLKQGRAAYIPWPLTTSEEQTSTYWALSSQPLLHRFKAILI